MGHLFEARPALSPGRRAGMSGGRGRAPRRACAYTACAVSVALLAAWVSPAPAAAGTVTLAPASGPSGTPVFAEGHGFGPRRRVTVRVGGAAVARSATTAGGAFRTSFTLHGRRSTVLRVVFAGGARRVVSNFRIVSRAAAIPDSEVASDSGTRLRWRPTGALPGARIDLSGGGFPPRRKASIQLGSVSLAPARSDRRGRILARPPVPPVAPGPYTLNVRAGSRRARFRFWVLSAARPAPPRAAPTRPPTRPPSRPRPAAPP
jgi:hypothetical protein